MKKLLVAGTIAVLGALFWSIAPAAAHHPEVAVTVCPGPTPLQDAVDVTASAWDLPDDWDPDHRVNTDVRIDVTGPGVDLSVAGEFVAPDYSFTHRFDIPDAEGKTLDVRVTALAKWGAGEDFQGTDDTAETTITVPLCTGSTTTTSVAPTSTEAPTTTAAPTSTAAPSTTAAPTSTEAPASTEAPQSTAPSTSVETEVETEVAGIVEVRPQVPGSATGDQTATAGQLAFSGSETGPLVLGGAGLLAIGAALVLSTRRRSD